MQKTKNILVFSLVLLVAATLVTTAVFAKKDDSKINNGKADSVKNEKSDKTKDLKNYEKSTNEKSNAAIHKEKVEEVSSELKEAAAEEKNKGQQNREEKTEEKKINNPDVGEQENAKVKTREEVAATLEEVAEEVEEVEDETVEAIEEVEEDGGFKKFFLGADYKNLGQLRSSLVHNRNQIRKLTQLSAGVTDEETKAAIDDQLLLLTQERERIKTVVTNNEGGFSLLGWVFRFVNGYPSDSINDEEEEALNNEVEDAINGDNEEAANEADDSEEVGETEEGSEDQTNGGNTETETTTDTTTN